MARLARTIVPGVADHVTQRGNNRQDVFFVANDRRAISRAARECDGNPDFADGYNRDGTASNDDDSCTGLQFVPVVLKISKPEKASIESAIFTITYNSSDPANVTEVGGVYTITDAGILRLWKDDGPSREMNPANAVQDPGDFIPGSGGEEYTAAQLGFTEYTMSQPFFVEAVRPSSTVADQQIKVEVDWDGEGTEWVATEDAVRVTAYDIDLLQVSFSGTGYHAVREDDNSNDYGAPHWQDNTPGHDGDADDAGDRRYPVCFQGGATVQLSAEWELTPASAGPVRVRGHASLALEIPATSGNVVGAQVTLPATAASMALANEVDFVNPFQITWEFSIATTNWIPAGTSRNRMYVTLGTPAANVLYESLLHIGCSNADGAATAATAVPGIWNDFTDRVVRRKPVDGHNVADNVAMVYWRNNDPGTPQSLEGMLSDANGNGSCIAWSQLLHEVLDAQGITGSQIQEVTADATVNPGAEGLAVRNWLFAEHIRVGPNGICETSAAGDDVQGLGLDGQVSAITTYLDGICNTSAGGDDYQVIDEDHGEANATAITAGPDGVLDSTEEGDDQVVGNSITTGADGVCNTTAANDDVQQIDPDCGLPHTNAINCGANGICDTTAAPEDLQMQTPGSGGLANYLCVEPGGNGTLEAVTGGDDVVISGLLTGASHPYNYIIGRDCFDQAGLPGQSNPNPPAAFRSHFVVWYDNRIYDPSYGTGPFDAATSDHENSSIAGIYRILGETQVKQNEPHAEVRYDRSAGLE